MNDTLTCGQAAYWWDADVETRCVRHRGHLGGHSDGHDWFVMSHGLAIRLTIRTFGQEVMELWLRERHG